jgi:flagellin-like protein
MTKGVSEVVATVVLLGITVTAAGSYLTISSDFQESINPDTEISDFDFNVESCWSESGKIHLLVRNQDDESANVTGVNIFSDEGPVSNVEYSKEIVGPSETFTTDFEASNKDLRLVSGETEVEYSCRNVEIEPAGPGTDPGPGGDSGQVIEAGGEIGGQIDTISASQINITGDLCIGSDCSPVNGDNTTRDDDNYVNRSGDEMDGTIHPNEVKGDICLGSGCGTDFSDRDGFLGEESATSPFVLETEGVVGPVSGSLCLGENC